MCGMMMMMIYCDSAGGYSDQSSIGYYNEVGWGTTGNGEKPEGYSAVIRESITQLLLCIGLREKRVRRMERGNLEKYL